MHGTIDNQDITVKNAGVPHRIALHPEKIGSLFIPNQFIVKIKAPVHTMVSHRTKPAAWRLIPFREGPPLSVECVLMDIFLHDQWFLKSALCPVFEIVNRDPPQR
jgi:hypothetical protein